MYKLQLLVGDWYGKANGDFEEITSRPHLRGHEFSEEERKVSIPRTRITIGKSLANDVILNSPEVKEYHAVLQTQGDKTYIQDNGTFWTFIKRRNNIFGPLNPKPRRIYEQDVLIFGAGIEIKLLEIVPEQHTTFEE